MEGATAAAATALAARPADTTSLASPGIAIDLCADQDSAQESNSATPNGSRPPSLPLASPGHRDLHRNLTSPVLPTSGWQSPARHHRRTPSQHREIKETIDARTEYTSDDIDGRSQHCINQYRIIEEIGRGSYGSVHRAVDQYCKEFAVKEFSKSRLRRRAQSLIMRRPGPAGFRRPIRRAATDIEEPKDALYLIRQEVAIMKKLNHDNLVQLIEVLDDPEEDSLYMVLEMCKKGTVMKIEVGQSTQPLEQEKARCCFRDLILGIEYLHGQKICHRDIKPDNLLMTDDDVLKIVDFGVSEMFAKPQEMRTAKTAGSPAFIPPELCGKHSDVSGTAADIWSMGICLYCFRYGHLPFDHDNPLDLYESIQNDALPLPDSEDPVFRDLIVRILEKDPERRITMAELREHPWVTKNGNDTLLPAEENCSDLVGVPNSLEVNHAFTRKISHTFSVIKAIRKFLDLRDRDSERKRLPNTVCMDESNGDANLEMAEALVRARKKFTHDQQTLGMDTILYGATAEAPVEKGALLLGIGTGGHDDFGHLSDPTRPEQAREREQAVVSDSPIGVGDDINIYDRAFQEKVESIRRTKSIKHGDTKTKLYLTKLVVDASTVDGEAIPPPAEDFDARPEGRQQEQPKEIN